MKIDIGGGHNPQKGFANVDQILEADYCLDLENDPLPFDDDSIEEAYSAHTFEHIANLRWVLHEIVRVCRDGAPVEIRVPHWNHPMTHCPGHLHALSEEAVRQWETFPEVWWGRDSRKMLHLDLVEYVASLDFPEAVRLFKPLGFTEDQILRFVPNTCFEMRFFFIVVKNPLHGE